MHLPSAALRSSARPNGSQSWEAERAHRRSTTPALPPAVEIAAQTDPDWSLPPPIAHCCRFTAPLPQLARTTLAPTADFDWARHSPSSAPATVPDRSLVTVAWTTSRNGLA